MEHPENILFILITFNKFQLFKKFTFLLKVVIEENAYSNDVFGETTGTSLALKIISDKSPLNCEPFPYNGIPPNSRTSML